MGRRHGAGLTRTGVPGQGRLDWKLGWCGGVCGRELQDMLTQRLEGGNPRLDTGEHLREVGFQQDADRGSSAWPMVPDQRSASEIDPPVGSVPTYS